MSKKKILLLGKLPPPYMGPAIATEIILRSSINQYYEMLHLNTQINPSINAIGKWRLGKFFRNVSLYFQMIRILSQQKPHLVLIPISQSTLGFMKDSFFILLAKFFDIKVLIHLRGSNFINWLTYSSNITRWWVKLVIQKTHGVIVLGSNLKFLFDDYFKEDKIFVVPNGANYSIPDSAKKYNEPVKLIHISNLMASKGLEDVLEALSLVKEKCQIPFSLDIMGEWCEDSTKQKCMNYIEKNLLPVHFIPPSFSYEKMIFLSSSDIFIFTPRGPEGHPWVIIEAMAAGLPIISTNKGAIIESVQDGVNGFIVEAKNPIQMQEKIKLLLENSELRKKMGGKSRKVYLENFTEEKMVQKLKYAFNKILNDQ